MKPEDEARLAEAKQAIERAHRDSETLGGSTMARAAGEKAQGWADHFLAKDANGLGNGGETDFAELWGRRIGRSLSLIGVIVLAYMLGQQLKMW